MTPRGGTVYTIWGKETCPEIKGAETLYSGITGGTLYSQSGGGSNYLCVPKDPIYDPHVDYSEEETALLYGTEYERPYRGTHNDNVPCAVCRVPTRTAFVMIPAKEHCPIFWTTEYFGYLMVNEDSSQRTEFICVSRDQEGLPNSWRNTDGARLSHVEASCGDGGFDCPPFQKGKELNCIVCTI